MSGDYISEYMGLVAASTSNRGQAPQYGLVYDLSTGQWQNAAQFRQFVRDQLPVTQQQAKQQADIISAQSLKAQELERAQNFQDHGLFVTRSELGVDKSGVGNQIMTGFKAVGGHLKNLGSDFAARPARAIPVVGGWLGAVGIGQGPDESKDLYKGYSKAGGLLSEEEFNSFNHETQYRLFDHAKGNKNIADTAAKPGVAQGLWGLDKAYRGVIAGVEMSTHPLEYTSTERWAQAWREAQGESLGNALVNLALDPFYSQETLDRWKRENPWYQMTSAGTEFAVGWYADPAVIAGKGLGGAARLSRAEMPLNEASAVSKGMTQALQREQITIRNPITKGIVNARVNRMSQGWKNIEDYALAVDPHTFARELPMLAPRYRAVDGGAGGYALHWAYNNKAAANELLSSQRVRGAMQDVADEFDFSLPEHLDVADLTQQLMLGDPKAYAMLNKLHSVTPDELAQIAPGSGTLLSAMDALTTKATHLQSEVDDLLKEADAIAAGGGKQTGLPMFHRWEVHTSLEDRQRQLGEVTDALKKYDGYQNWLDLTTGVKANPRIKRVQGPSKSRWSEVRNRDLATETESRSLFMDGQYGHAHSFMRMPKGLFLKRANTAELHDFDSGLMSINRQFDQFENYFGYVPEGARDATLSAYVSAKTPYDRYKIFHDLEETHLIGGIASKFNLDPETARVIVHKIYDERNRTINGILSGEGQVYRSAPGLGARLGGGKDSTLELVARDPEAGTVTVNMIKGRQKETFEIPEAALQPRVSPEDVTQTPNYYNPLDTRRLYYKLKHDHRLLEELNAGVASRSKAALADLGEVIGTRFNEFWKPVQLFRLGWPMRVLMDEGARATAIYGPMYWLTGPGAESVYQSGRNTLPIVADYIARKRRGPLGVNMLGSGTVEKVARQAPDQFARDYEVTHAVQLPESLWDKINPDRLEKIRSHAAAYDNWKRANGRAHLWRGGYNTPGELGRLLSSNTNLTPAQQRALDYGLNASQFAEAMPDAPIRRAVRDFQDRADAATSRGRANGMRGLPLGEEPWVYDPARGNRHQSGYVVPIPDDVLDVVFHASNDTTAIAHQMAWYAKNIERLSRNGMRIVVGADGKITVGRHFRSNEFTKARQYAEYVSEKHPDLEMWDLGKKQSYRVQDANEMSPITEATYRRFANEELTERRPGKAPVEGEPEVYHGTNEDLPEDLHPRQDVGIANGRMVGSGLYTTTSQEIAESYGVVNLYTIRGAKSGRQYKVWDLDQPITQAQKNDLLGWLEARGGTFDYDRAELRRMLEDPSANPYRVTKHAEELTWANLYEDLVEDEQFHGLLHEYLEEVHGAGALTHTGGTTHGHPHQVYVWLHPEDLVVKPLYAGTGKYVSLPEWFSHPQSVENLVPENRIIRKGTRNPMLRELRTIGNRLDNDFDNLTGNESAALLERERSLMEALGLGRRRHAVSAQPKTNPLLPNRYYVKDANHFNQMVDEARTEDEARTLRAAANDNLLAQEEAVGGIGGTLDDFDFEIDSPTDWLLRKIRTRHEMGRTWKKVKSSDGKEFYTEGAFANHRGELFRGFVGSNGVIDVLSEGRGGGTSLFRRQSEGYRVYQPPEFSDKALTNVRSVEHKKAVRYYQVYADMVNDHLGSSPIIQKIIKARAKGQTDEQVVDGVSHWLETTPEGQRILAEVKPKDMPTEIWVDDHVFKFDTYVPSRKLQRLLGKGRLNPSDFRKNIADEDLPTIYGPDLEVLDRRRGVGRFLTDTADRFWYGLGTMPIDAFSRHPFAKAAYDTKIRNLINTTDSKWLTPEKIEAMQNEARQYALQQVKRHLYNLTDTTNFNDALRFVAPFWGAQYEAIQKWLRIISDRPETVARFFGGQRAVYNNFVVVDEDGNEVKKGMRPGGLHNLGAYHPTDMVVMQIPKGIQKRFGLEGITSTRIPIGSANTVLQGDLPLFPSVGPLVTIPADQFTRKVSDTYGVEHDQDLLYRWLFPIGRPRSKNALNQMLDQFMPGWVNRVRQSSGPEDAQARINMEMLIGREMTFRARKLGKPDPTAEEIAKAADHLWHVRVISGLVQPFQVQFMPDHQYWIDAAHRYQKEYGSEWWDKYIDDYGEEAAIFATSSSNSIGVPPTAQGMEEWSKNKTLIAKYPQWASAIISPQAYMGEFSPDAYGQQFNITLGPGDTRALRSGTSLQDRLVTDPEIKLGWREYRKFNAAIESELYARGLTSIQQSQAADLVQLKRAFISDLSKKYGAWARDYQVQSDQIYSDVEDLKKIAPMPIFDNRPDMLGVRQYLMIRQQVVDLLDQHAVEGGSRSLQAQENGALRDWFYNQVGQIVLNNPSFAEFYSRYLDSDTLTLGGGGF